MSSLMVPPLCYTVPVSSCPPLPRPVGCEDLRWGLCPIHSPELSDLHRLLRNDRPLVVAEVTKTQGGEADLSSPKTASHHPRAGAMEHVAEVSLARKNALRWAAPLASQSASDLDSDGHIGHPAWGLCPTLFSILARTQQLPWDSDVIGLRRSQSIRSA